MKKDDILVHVFSLLLQYFRICVFLQSQKKKTMCTYPISLDENLVMQAEKVLQIDESFQTWLQQQVEKWLLSQVNEKKRFHSHSKLTDEMLAERLKDYPQLEESDFPSLAAEDYSTYLKSRSGQLPKGIEKWL
jgi:hypothetical protein